MPRSRLSTPDEKVVARLEMVVTYDTLPDIRELADLVDKARELGGVDKAELTVLKAVTHSLV